MRVAMKLLPVLAKKKIGARIAASSKKNVKTVETCPVCVVALARVSARSVVNHKKSAEIAAMSDVRALVACAMTKICEIRFGFLSASH